VLLCCVREPRREGERAEPHPLSPGAPNKALQPMPSSVRSRPAEIQSVWAHSHTLRTAEQTEVAIYWTVWTHLPFNAAARAAATRRGHLLVDNARLLALLNMVGADSQIACWYWKYRFNFWRPVTAIRAEDGAKNASLTSDPNWEPLLNTPAHPDYPSGHATYGGAAAEVSKAVFDDDHVDLERFPGRCMASTSTSTVGTGVLHPKAPCTRVKTALSFVLTNVTRTYTSFSQLDREIIDARVWGGIYVRKTNEDSSALGHKIGVYAVQTWLRPASPNVGVR
jgi:hypothetical protein